MRRSGAEGQEEKRQTKKNGTKTIYKEKRISQKETTQQKVGLMLNFTLVSKHKSSRQKVHVTLFEKKLRPATIVAVVIQAKSIKV